MKKWPYIVLILTTSLSASASLASPIWGDAVQAEGAQAFYLEVDDEAWRKGWHGDLDRTSLNINRSEKSTPSAHSVAVEFAEGKLRLLECSRQCVLAKEVEWDADSRIDALGLYITAQGKGDLCPTSEDTCEMFIPSWSLGGLKAADRFYYYPQQVAIIAHTDKFQVFSAHGDRGFVGSFLLDSEGEVSRVNYRGNGVLEFSQNKNRYQVDFRQDSAFRKSTAGDLTWRPMTELSWRSLGPNDRVKAPSFAIVPSPEDCNYGNGTVVGQSILFNTNGEMRACVEDRLFALPFTNLGEGWANLRIDARGYVVSYHAASCEVRIFSQISSARWQLTSKYKSCGAVGAEVSLTNSKLSVCFRQANAIDHLTLDLNQ